jgi:hypothetical protein
METRLNKRTGIANKNRNMYTLILYKSINSQVPFAPIYTTGLISAVTLDGYVGDLYSWAPWTLLNSSATYEDMTGTGYAGRKALQLLNTPLSVPSQLLHTGTDTTTTYTFPTAGTITMRLKSSSFTNYQSFFECSWKGISGDYTNVNTPFYRGTNNVWEVGKHTVAGGTSQPGNYIPSTGIWYSLAMTWNGSGSVNLYVNCVYVSTTSSGTRNGVTIGYGYETGHWTFAGAVADFRMYNAVLPQLTLVDIANGIA